MERERGDSGELLLADASLSHLLEHRSSLLACLGGPCTHVTAPFDPQRYHNRLWNNRLPQGECSFDAPNPVGIAAYLSFIYFTMA